MGERIMLARDSLSRFARCVLFACAIMSIHLAHGKESSANQDLKEGVKNELQDALSGLGMMDDAVEDATGHVGGAQEGIPMPDPPMSPATMDADDVDDDDNEPSYLDMKNQKEIYEDGMGIVHLNTNNFDESIFNGKQDLTIVHFYTRWCKNCQFHGTSIRAAGERYKDDPKVKIYAVNQEGNYDLAARFDTDPGDSSFFYARKDPQID